MDGLYTILFGIITGTKRHDLHKYAKETLGTGDMKSTVSLLDWKYVTAKTTKMAHLTHLLRNVPMHDGCRWHYQLGRIRTSG
jgi:hypothetical protein